MLTTLFRNLLLPKKRPAKITTIVPLAAPAPIPIFAPVPRDDEALDFGIADGFVEVAIGIADGFVEVAPVVCNVEVELADWEEELSNFAAIADMS